MTGWKIFFFLLGIVSLIAQATFLRESTNLLYGNELFYSLGLSIWLLSCGLGSLFGKKLFPKKKLLPWIILFFLLIILPFIILGLKFIVAKTTLTGELTNPFPTFFILLAIFSLYSFLFGLLFPLTISCFKKNKNFPVNSAYLWETLGLVLGGIIFSFLLSQTSFPLPEKINITSTKWLFPQLEKVVNSKYQRIIMSKTKEQTNFFLNNQLTFTTSENFENQNFFRLIEPYTANPKKILVVGNPVFANFLQSKFPEANITLLEIDKDYFLSWQDLLDNRIRVTIADYRRFLKKSLEKYDLIFCLPGNPQTLLTNRFFTQQSFNIFKKNLNNNGVFILSFSLPTDYQGKEAAIFGASIYKTIKSVFPNNELLVKDEQIVLLAGENLSAKVDLENNYFLYQFQSTQRKKIIQDWSANKVKINTDEQPTAFFYYQLFWQKILNANFPQFLAIVARVAPLLILLVLFFLSRKKGAFSSGIIIFISSFVLITLETLVIFMFQTKIGFLFSQISLIFSTFLAGMVLGITLAKLPVITLKKSWLALLSSLVLFFFLVKTPVTEWYLFWFLADFVFGIFGGINFSLINNFYLNKNNHPGFIYAFDLIGSSVGALLASSIFLPVYGIKQILLFLIGISIVSFIAIYRQ